MYVITRRHLFVEMGRLRFELRTSRLKAGCSTAELATRPLGHARNRHEWTLSLGQPQDQDIFRFTNARCSTLACSQIA